MINWSDGRVLHGLSIHSGKQYQRVLQNTKESSSVSSNNTRWLAPPAGTYTVNVDASGLASLSETAWGAVIQAVSGRFHHILNIEHAEMKTILEGLKQLLCLKNCSFY